MVSAMLMSPAAGENTSADSSVTSVVRSPAPIVVSGCHWSSLKPVLVARKEIGDPAWAAESRWMRCAGPRWYKAIQNHYVGLDCGVKLSGDSNTASTCGFAANSGRSNCGSLE